MNNATSIAAKTVHATGAITMVPAMKETTVCFTVVMSVIHAKTIIGTKYIITLDNLSCLFSTLLKSQAAKRQIFITSEEHLHRSGIR